MTLVNLAVLLREFQVRNLPVGRVSVEAVDADGAHVAIAGRNVTFSVKAEVTVADGLPVAPIVLDPTDGTYCIRWRIYAPDESLMLTRYTVIPNQAEVDFGALVLVSPADFQPTEDVVAAWHVVVAAANAAAAAAALSASQALTSRNTAQAAATLAGERAAAASDAADDADLSFQDARSQRQAAQVARDQAQGFRNQANDSAASADDSSAFAYQASIEAGARKAEAEAARTGAETARAGAETARAGAETARAGAETAQAGSESARNQAQAYRDQALAGQFAGADLGTANLDTITTPGVYRQSSGTRATIAQNYPDEGSPIAMIVETSGTGGSGLVQRAIIPWRTGRAGRGEYVRTRFAATDPWGPWLFMPTVSVDQTAGRVFYMWDPASQRPQMIYGDTGRRVITAAFGSTVTNGGIILSRYGRTVNLVFNNVTIPTKLTVADVIPVGFRVTNAAVFAIGNNNPLITVFGDGSVSLPAVANHYGSITYLTEQPWPSTLPGSPDGSIPTS